MVVVPDLVLVNPVFGSAVAELAGEAIASSSWWHPAVPGPRRPDRSAGATEHGSGAKNVGRCALVFAVDERPWFEELLDHLRKETGEPGFRG